MGAAGTACTPQTCFTVSTVGALLTAAATETLAALFAVDAAIAVRTTARKAQDVAIVMRGLHESRGWAVALNMKIANVLSDALDCAFHADVLSFYILEKENREGTDAAPCAGPRPAVFEQFYDMLGSA